MALPPITDISSLYLNLSDWLARNDLEQYYPTFIGLAEARLETRLKAPGMEYETIINSDSSNSYPLPDDYIEWLSATWFSTEDSTQQTVRNVEANSPEFTNRFRPNGNPQFYAVLAGKVKLKPERTGKVLLAYYRRLPRLTTANPTNWLLTKAPQVYLAAILAEAYAFQKDETRTIEWMKAMDERLAAFIEESAGNKVGRRATRDAEVAAEQIAAKAIV